MIEIIEEVMWIFRDSMKKELTGKYTSLWNNEVIVLINWIETLLYKKILLHKNKVNDIK